MPTRKPLGSSGIARCAAAAIVLAACSSPPDAGEPSRVASAMGVGAPSRSGIDTGSLPQRFGYGRPATEAEIAALDVDVGPDGAGLPPGQGTVGEGEVVYRAQCASCHGAGGEGVPGVGTRLVGTEPIDSTGWNRTIGNFWPYATTLFDYTRRAMPFDRPGSLSDPQVYAVTAYMLHLNEIIPADAVLDAAALPRVAMPARDRFVPDDREGRTTVH